jgi:lysophospholipase L1-like esterase
MKKVVLCYGDSNTWGFVPNRGLRFPAHVRWPGVLQRCLGLEYEIVEEGLNGRTAFSFYPDGNPLNGCEYLFSCLKAYADSPLATLILYLGINDIFCDRSVTAAEIADRVGQAATLAARTDSVDQIVLLSPLPVNEGVEFASFYESEIERARRFSEHFRAKASELECLFVDPAEVISASELDGVHIDGPNHVRLGEHLCRFIMERFRDTR